MTMVVASVKVRHACTGWFGFIRESLLESRWITDGTRETIARRSVTTVGDNVVVFVMTPSACLSFVCFFQDKSLEKTNVKIDWNKFVDEDEEEGAGGTKTLRCFVLNFG